MCLRFVDVVGGEKDVSVGIPYAMLGGAIGLMPTLWLVAGLYN